VSRGRPYPSSVRAAAGTWLRLARDDDAPFIAEWTHDSAVHRWWGGRELTVEEVLAKYTGRRAPEVVSYVICEQGRAMGYAQAWQRTDGFGLDMFIAAGAQGRGLGPLAARALAEELHAAGWVPLTVDPALDNTRAIRAWRSAGFVATGEPADDGGVLVQVMTFTP
jgi:aminoglycoside 6'-N-acetyltransferase